MGNQNKRRGRYSNTKNRTTKENTTENLKAKPNNTSAPVESSMSEPTKAKAPAKKRYYKKKNKNGNVTINGNPSQVQVKTIIKPTFKNKETITSDLKVEVINQPTQVESSTNVLETSIEVKESSIQKEVSHKLEAINVSETSKDSTYGIHFIDEKTKSSNLFTRLVNRLKKWFGK